MFSGSNVDDVGGTVVVEGLGVVGGSGRVELTEKGFVDLVDGSVDIVVISTVVVVVVGSSVIEVVVVVDVVVIEEVVVGSSVIVVVGS